jgi:hypothetical protein
MPIPMTSRTVVPADVLINVIDGESVLLNLKTESYFGLDDVGTRMWQVLTASASIAAARDTLVAEYDSDPERIQHDLEALIEKLVEQGLLEIVND